MTVHLLPIHPFIGGVSVTVDALVAASISQGRNARIATYPPDAGGRAVRLGRAVPEPLLLPVDPLVQGLVADRDVDRVVLHGVFTPLLARASAVLRRRRPDVTLVAVPHDPYGPELFGTRPLLKEAYWRAEERRYLDRCDVVVVSAPRHEALLRGRGVRTPALVAGPGLTADDVAAAARIRTGRTAAPPTGIWLVLGRWDVFEKGLDLLLEAFGAERGNLPGVRLRLVGPETGARAELERLRTAAQLTADDVELVGWAEDPWAEIAAADALLMPSRKEGFGLSGLQGLASGIPLLISTSAGLADAVAGRPGVVTADPDLAGVRRALTELAVSSGALRSAAGGTGADVAGSLTASAMADAIEGWGRAIVG